VVVGFPLGAMVTRAKVAETMAAIDDGAQEIDMVVNIGYLKGKEFDLFLQDIEAVVKTCHGRGVICKAILEMCLLDHEEKVKAIDLAIEAGADFIKTSTGFSTGGATVEDVAMMHTKAAASKHCQVKASGGIRDGETAMAMINAGATRLGTSATMKVIEEMTGMIQIPSSGDSPVEKKPRKSEGY
jgi:deoxyribose-phosphate aldolase